MSVSKIFISCLVNSGTGSALRAARSAHAQQRVLPFSFRLVLAGRESGCFCWLFFVMCTLKSSQTISEMADCLANESEK